MLNEAETNILIEKTSLADQVFLQIKRMILSQELDEGECIREDRIAKAFGVSRTPIREAFRKLEKYGLVKIVPRSKVKVVEVGPEEADYLRDVRNELESLAIKNLAKIAKSEDIDNLKKIAQKGIQYLKKGKTVEAFESDGLFHLEISKRSGNPYIYSILKTLDAKIQLVRTKNYINEEVILSNMEFHFKIIDAIEKHDVKNSQMLLRAHINNFLKRQKTRSS